MTRMLSSQKSLVLAIELFPVQNMRIAIILLLLFVFLQSLKFHQRVHTSPLTAEQRILHRHI